MTATTATAATAATTATTATSNAIVLTNDLNNNLNKLNKFSNKMLVNYNNKLYIVDRHTYDDLEKLRIQQRKDIYDTLEKQYPEWVHTVTCDNIYGNVFGHKYTEYDQELKDLASKISNDAFNDAFSTVANKFDTLICYKPADFDDWAALNNMVLDYTYRNGIKIYTSDLDILRLAALNNVEAFLYNYLTCCTYVDSLIDVMRWLNGEDVHFDTIIRDFIYYSVYNDIERTDIDAEVAA